MDKDKSENLNATGPVGDQSRISQKTGTSHVSKYNGPNLESHCFVKRLSTLLKLKDDSIKSERLDAIHSEDIDQLKESFQEFKENSKLQKYKQEVMICFWYAIHCEQTQMAQYIYTLDGTIKGIMKNLRDNPNTKFELEVHRRKQIDIKKKALVQIENEDDESNQINSSQKQDSDDENDSSQKKMNDGSGQKNNQQIDNFNIQSRKDIKEIKYVLTKVNCKSGAPFNTNVLRIALNLKEEYIASLILDKKYQISMDEKIIIRAIKSEQFDFLFWVFARNQNYEELEQNKQLNHLESKSQTQQDSASQFSQDSPQFKVFTYEYLFQQIKIYQENKTDEICQKIGEWEQISSENIIESMLKNKLDLVAVHTGKLELKKEYCNHHVFEYALENSNEVFLKQSFKNPDSIYQASILEKKEIKNKIFEMLENGKNILLMLNVLIYAEFDKWTEKETYLKNLFEILENMCQADVEPNMSYMCYNPILMICLSCEALKKIGEAYSILKQECSEASEELLKLGEMLLEEMDKEVVNVLYMDVDFLDRTTLKLISENEYETLILNFKVDALLDQLWSGKSNECNGYVSDYSLLTYLASAPIRKLPGQMIEFDSLTFNNFKDQIEKETFPIQFDYRMNSINEIFNKELLFTIFICTIMIVINITFVQNFALSNFASYPSNIGLLQPYLCNDAYWAIFNVTIPECNPPTTDTSTDTNTDDNSTTTQDNTTQTTTDNSSTSDNNTQTANNTSNINDNSTQFIDNNESQSDNTNNTENENEIQNIDSSSSQYDVSPPLKNSFSLINNSQIQINFQKPQNVTQISQNSIINKNISTINITNNFSMLMNQSQTQNQSSSSMQILNGTNLKKRSLQDANSSETDSQPNNTNPFLYGYFTDDFLNNLTSQNIYFDNFTLSNTDGQLYIVNNYSDIQVQIDYWQQQQYIFTQEQINDYNMWNNIGLIISVSLIFYVVKKLIFNLYAIIPLSMDKWSLIDIGCSIVNLVSFLYIQTIDYDAINDQSKKIYYNTFMVLIIFATWTRFTGIGMIINTFCVLIVSILASIAVTANFCIATTLYHIMMMFFRYINFQGMVYGYDNFFACFRAVLFEFDWGGNNLYTVYYSNDYYYYYNVLAMMIHLTINKIIIQNYLVAVVSGVYEENEEVGEVKYKSNKYQYIERYYLAQQNQYGYQELISHPPPFNLMLVFLLPSIFNQDKMKKNSIIFSKIVFWIENICFYIPKEFMQELMLMPYIYGRTLFYTIKFADRPFCIYQILGWAFLGPFFLLYGICFDMCNFIKVLMIVKKKEDEDIQDEINNDGQKQQKKQSINQEEQSQLQEKIQIYNEIIQVIQFILFVFFNERKIREEEESKKTEKEKQSTDGLEQISEEDQKEKKRNTKNVITLDQALKIENNEEEEGSQNADKKQEENKEEEEEEEIKEGYSLEKSIICEAWARYREDQKKNENKVQSIKTEYGFDKKNLPKEQEYLFNPDDPTDYEINFSLFSQQFIDYVLSSINLKIYQYTESEVQKKRKKDFKNNFSKYYQVKMLDEQIKKKQDLDTYQEYIQREDPTLDNKKIQEKLELRKQQQSRLKFDDIKREEKEIIEELLKCFIQQSDNAALIDQIDLSLTLKALPTKVDEQNVKRCELFNFEHTASSLIAFECEDQDLLFKYYDTRNKTRLNKLNKKANNTEKLTKQLIDDSNEVLKILSEIKQQGKISDYHTKVLETND